MGWMGMELGITPRLLQPRVLGWMAESLSSAAPLVPPATGGVGQPARLRWQLALSSAELSASQSSRAAAGLQSSALRTEQSAGLQTTFKSAGPPIDTTSKSWHAQPTWAESAGTKSATNTRHNEAGATESPVGATGATRANETNSAGPSVGAADPARF